MDSEFGEKRKGLLFTETSINKISYVDKGTSLEPTSRESSIRTNKFFERLQDVIYSQPNQVLPQNTRFYKRIGRKWIYVIEWQPSIRSIFVDRDLGSEYQELVSTGKSSLIDEEDAKSKRFTLSFPYLVWVVSCVESSTNPVVNNARLFFRLNPLSSLSDPLIFPPLPNILTGGSLNGYGGRDFRNRTIETICLGERHGRRTQNMSELVEDTLSLFFKNRFNNDYPDLYSYYREFKDSTFSNIFLWQYMTKKDPMFIFKDKWAFTNYSIGDYLNSLVNLEFRGNVSPLTHFDELEHFIENEITYDHENNRLFKDNRIREEIGIGGHQLNIGDDIKHNNKLCYINSIIKDYDANKTNLEIEYDEDGTNEIIQINAKLKEEIEEYFNENVIGNKRLNTIVSNTGEEISVGDYVWSKSDPIISFIKVKDIIKTRDGFTEIKIGKRRYFPTVELVKFNEENMNKIFGGEVKEGTELIEENTYSTSPFSGWFVGGIRTCNITRVNELVYGRHGIYLDTERGDITTFNNFKIFSGQNNKIEESTVRSGLLLINSDYSIRNEYSFFLDYDSEKVIVPENEIGNLFFNKNRAISDIIKNSNISIKSINYDIELNIGDEVVVSDWDNLDEMVKIRKIIGFELVNINNENVLFEFSNMTTQDEINEFLNDEQLSNVYVIRVKTVDEDLNERSFTYIDFFRSERFYGIIHFPTIRKIDRNYGNFNSGDKVKASESKIPGFPKKDTNEIIGFINDTGCEFPLVLMSNALTLRSNDLEKFFVKVDNNKPISGKRSPNKRIDGDLFIKVSGSGKKFLITGFFNNSTEEIYESQGYFMMDNSELTKKRYGFPNPQFDTLRENLEFISSKPNFRNWFNNVE